MNKRMRDMAQRWRIEFGPAKNTFKEDAEGDFVRNAYLAGFKAAVEMAANRARDLSEAYSSLAWDEEKAFGAKRAEEEIRALIAEDGK